MRYRHQGPRSPKVNGLEMQALAEPGVGEYISFVQVCWAQLPSRGRGLGVGTGLFEAGG